MRTKNILIIAIIVATLLLPIDRARADQESTPYDYAIITADKKYIFVMLIPDEEIMQAWEYLNEEPTFYETRIFDTEISMKQYWDAIQEKFSLRTKYPCSGLYKNDGSTTPIWTVNWYGFVYLFSDGEHLIRRGPWNRSWEPGRDSYLDGLAVAFYKNGYEVTKYSVGDLVKDTDAIRFSVSHYQWKEEERFDIETGLLFIKTLDHQEYTFDIREMAESVKGRHTYCEPNYRFKSPKQNKDIPALAISVVAFLVLIGSASLVNLIQKTRK